MAKIAIIDDDPDMLRMIERMLVNKGYECVAFNAAKLALESLEGTDVDLILTDVYMPGLDGFDLISRAKVKLPGVPIIAMSGGGRLLQIDMLADTKTFGAVAALHKPFSQRDLVALVEQVLDGVDQGQARTS